MPRTRTALTFSTCLFLVLLRLAIGWHFFIEGMEKATTPGWSSEAYLRESSGPAAPLFRWMAGDAVVDKLTPQPVAAGEDPNRTPLNRRFPPALAREWDAYFDAFVSHYGLQGEQLERARDKFRQEKEQTMAWLLNDKKTVNYTSPYGPPVPSDKTVAERIEQYEKALEQLRAAQSRELAPGAFVSQTRDPSLADMNAARTEANRIRNDLKADLTQQTARMKDALYEQLTDEQKAKGPLPEPVKPGVLGWNRLEWIDASVCWGVLAVGLLLLLGLFSRPAAVAGAIYLVLFYLAMPALPGLPDNPRAEGHYLIVNKNLIEALALLALATVPSGRWFGFDALLQFLSPGRWRSRPASPVVPDSRSVEPALRPEPAPVMAEGSATQEEYPDTPFTPQVPIQRD